MFTSIHTLYMYTRGVVVAMAEKVMLSARVPKELKELVDSDQRTNQEVVKAALWREFGGKRVDALDRRIEEKKRRISMVESEKNERERELNEHKRELEALQEKRDTAAGQHEQELDTARENLNGVPRDPSNPAIKTQAQKLGLTPQELIKKLE